MANLQEQIVALEEQLAASEATKNALAAGDPMAYEASVNQYNQLMSQLSELKDQQAAEERKQTTQDAIGTYVDTLSEMFEVLFPSEVYRSQFGINEYEEKRAQFYQLNHAYFAEKVEELSQQNEMALALKDERIRLVNDQSLKVQQQLDESRAENQSLREELQQEREEHVQEIELIRAELDKTKSELVDVKVERDSLATSHAEALAKNNELQAKLEAAPKAEVKAPSQKLADLMGEIKAKNEGRIKTQAELAAEGALGFRGKITLPEKQPEPPVLQFRPEADSTLTAGNQLLVTKEVAPVEQSQFPTIGTGIILPPHIQTLVLPGSDGMADGQPVRDGAAEEVGPVTRTYLEERLAQFAAEYGLVKTNVA